jgi:hypothetical protein
MLHFDQRWRLVAPGPISTEVQDEFYGLIMKVATQGGRRQSILEHYKTYFAAAAGRASSTSSSEGWAETDLMGLMAEARENAPLFIEAFFDAGTALHNRHPEFIVPDPTMINFYLAKHGAGYEVSPPNLISRNPHTPIEVPHVPSLDEQAREEIQRSLKQSDDYLSAGQHRQAVQEILWLLETVSTLFEGLTVGNATVEGKYFNKIAADLKKHQKGKTFEQVLNWATALHGYLSAPKGGGVRHGANLKAGVTMQANEARLFCNLIRSYIDFLLAEYDRLKEWT